MVYEIYMQIDITCAKLIGGGSVVVLFTTSSCSKWEEKDKGRKEKIYGYKKATVLLNNNSRTTFQSTVPPPPTPEACAPPWNDNVKPSVLSVRQHKNAKVAELPSPERGHRRRDLTPLQGRTDPEAPHQCPLESTFSFWAK